MIAYLSPSSASLRNELDPLRVVSRLIVILWMSHHYCSKALYPYDLLLLPYSPPGINPAAYMKLYDAVGTEIVKPVDVRCAASRLSQLLPPLIRCSKSHGWKRGNIRRDTASG